MTQREPVGLATGGMHTNLMGYSKTCRRGTKSLIAYRIEAGLRSKTCPS